MTYGRLECFIPPIRLCLAIHKAKYCAYHWNMATSDWCACKNGLASVSWLRKSLPCCHWDEDIVNACMTYYIRDPSWELTMEEFLIQLYHESALHLIRKRQLWSTSEGLTNIPLLVKSYDSELKKYGFPKDKTYDTELIREWLNYVVNPNAIAPKATSFQNIQIIHPRFVRKKTGVRIPFELLTALFVSLPMRALGCPHFALCFGVEFPNQGGVITYYEKVDGIILREWIRKQPFTDDYSNRILTMYQQIAMAVLMAWDRFGFTHYDLKDDNVVVRTLQEQIPFLEYSFLNNKECIRLTTLPSNNMTSSSSSENVHSSIDIPVLIDFESSCFTIHEFHMGNFGKHEYGIPNPVGNSQSRGRIVQDLYRLARCFWDAIECKKQMTPFLQNYFESLFSPQWHTLLNEDRWFMPFGKMDSFTSTEWIQRILGSHRNSIYVTNPNLQEGCDKSIQTDPPPTLIHRLALEPEKFQAQVGRLKQYVEKEIQSWPKN